jgi:hypothetical protein
LKLIIFSAIYIGFLSFSSSKGTATQSYPDENILLP